MKSSQSYRIPLITVLVITMMLLCGGCTTIDIQYGVTADHTAYFEYTAYVDVTDSSFGTVTHIPKLFTAIREYWMDKGYTAKVKYDSEAYILTVRGEETFETHEEAFDQLHAYMTQDISVMEQVTYEYVPSYYTDLYTLSGTLDISGSINQADIAGLPQSALDDYEDNIEKIQWNLSIELPQNLNTETDSFETLRVNQSIPLDEPMQWALDGRIEYAEHHNEYQQLQRDINDQQDDLRTIVIVGGGILLAALIVMIALIIVNHKRHSMK